MKKPLTMLATPHVCRHPWAKLDSDNIKHRVEMKGPPEERSLQVGRFSPPLSYSPWHECKPERGDGPQTVWEVGIRREQYRLVFQCLTGRPPPPASVSLKVEM